jgi:hypothetical protein
VDPGFPELGITLTAKEKLKHGQLCMNGNCEHLGPKGGVLGEEKPFSCKLYPLSFNPQSQTLYFDVDCPIMPQYVEQLSSSKSVASQHLARMASGIKKYMTSDPAFLKSNYMVDKGYFELKKLPAQPLKKEVLK